MAVLKLTRGRPGVDMLLWDSEGPVFIPTQHIAQVCPHESAGGLRYSMVTVAVPGPKGALHVYVREAAEKIATALAFLLASDGVWELRADGSVWVCPQPRLPGGAA